MLISARKAADIVGCSAVTVARYIQLGNINAAKERRGARIFYKIEEKEAERFRKWYTELPEEVRDNE